MKQKQQNMTWEDYLDQLEKESKKNPKSELRDKVCSDLGISKETYYYKNRNKSWNNLERNYLSQLAGIPEEFLFPEQKPEKVA